MICTDTYTSEQLSDGIILSFPIPGTNPCNTSSSEGVVFSSNISAAEEYFYYFDYVRILPEKPEPVIRFLPETAAYTMLGNKDFQPKIFVSVKYSHLSQIQVLFRLSIKNRYGAVLYTDYKLITTSGEEKFALNGRILRSNTSSNIGPNGFSIIELTNNSSNNTDEDENDRENDLVGLVRPGMLIEGPGIPEEESVYIKDIIFGSNNRFELTKLVDGSVNTNNSTIFEGLYTLTKDQSCVSPQTIEERETIGNYVILNKDNNWKYVFQNRVIANFYREDSTDEDIVIFLPVKSNAFLPNSEESSDIALAPIINIAGRVMGDTKCIVDVT